MIDVGDFSKVLIRGLGGDDILDASALGSERIMLGGPLRIPVTIEGGAGDDSITGGNWHDVLHGGRGNDSIFAGDGDDTVFAHDGHDEVHGGNGNDYLNGGPWTDRVFGDAGNDQIFALDDAVDAITGGDGFDRAKGDAIDSLLAIEAAL
jgi:Ca2+-binding RTX toxin-like protein